MDTLQQDLRYAFRTLLKSPNFAGIAVLSLAVGIGANVTIFSFLNGIYLNPLPYEDARELVSISSTHQEKGRRRTGVSLLDLEDWKVGTSLFKDIAAYHALSLNMSGVGIPERVLGGVVTQNAFPTLRVAPAHGRGFTSPDERVDAEPVVILSHGFWQRRFGGDPSILETSITLDGEPHAVIGVMPPHFVFLRMNPDLFLPARRGAKEMPLDRADRSWNIFARLSAGVTIEHAQQELALFAEHLADEHPATNAGWGVFVEPLRDVFLPSQDIESGFSVGFVAVGLLLFIACSNVASLLLARAGTRKFELAIRSTLGAGQGRIVRQLMTESAILASAGGVLGLGLAHGGVKVFIAASPIETSFFDFRIDTTVLAFAIVLSAATTLLFGLFPAIQAAGTDIVTPLKTGWEGTSKGGQHFVLTVVVLEVALAFVLLTAMAVLSQGLLRMHNKELGLIPENVLTLRMTPPRAKYKGEKTVDRFYGELIERIESLPGVISAGTTNNLTLSGADTVGPVTIMGHRKAPVARSYNVSLRSVSGDYFRTLSVRRLHGHGFTEADRAGAPLVAVVNEAFIREWFPGRSPLGERIVAWDDRPREIIGVVQDFYEVRLDRPIGPVVYLPSAQAPVRARSFAVRVTGDAASAAATVRRAIWSLDPDQPVSSVRLMSDYVSRAAWVFKMLTSSFGIFSVIALVMGAAGIYGITSFGVSRRRSEIGIRMALGASRSDILAMILREGSMRTLAGILLGLPPSLALTTVLAGALYGVARGDVVVWLVVSMLMMAVTLLACYAPASRASKVEPTETLQYE